MSLYRQTPYDTSKPSFFRCIGRLLFILLLLGGVCSAIFLLFFRGYVVSTEDGPRFELPFLANKQEAQAAFANEPSLSVPTEEPSSMPTPLHALSLSSDAIMEESAYHQMQQAGCNAVIFDMRTQDGALHYVSSLEFAIASGASAALPERNDAIRRMNQNPSLYTIARVSCFPDAKLAASNPDLCLMRPSGVPWRDQAQSAWLSPHNKTVQTYLFDICRELSALGFDEILLTNCSYPSKGFANQTFYDNDDSISAFSVTLEDFYQELHSILDAKQVYLSIQWEPSEQNNHNQELSGQTLESVVLSADRVWMHADWDEATEVFSSHGLSFPKSSLVLIVNALEESSFSWAMS